MADNAPVSVDKVLAFRVVDGHGEIRAHWFTSVNQTIRDSASTIPFDDYCNCRIEYAVDFKLESSRDGGRRRVADEDWEKAYEKCGERRRGVRAICHRVTPVSTLCSLHFIQRFGECNHRSCMCAQCMMFSTLIVRRDVCHRNKSEKEGFDAFHAATLLGASSCRSR